MSIHLRRVAITAALVTAASCLTAAPAALGQPGAGHPVVGHSGVGHRGVERIVFSSPLDGGGAAVGTIAPDGSGMTALSVGTDLEDFNKSTWSHDGKLLLHSNALVFDLPGEELAFRPAITDASGGNLRVLRLPDLSGDMYCSAWSPDDTRIACAVDGDLVSLRAADGGGRAPLTDNPYDPNEGGKDLAVGYSPDGRKLAFLRSRPGADTDEDAAERAALFVARADGSHARRLTRWGLLMAHELAGANWSPDGRWIISTTQVGQLVEIATHGRCVRKIRLALKGDTFAVTPDYSHDGRQLVAAVFRGSPADLYIADRDGSDARALTHTPEVNEWLPDWK